MCQSREITLTLNLLKEMYTISFFQLFIPKVMMMYVITVIGGLFYVTQFPEKIFPGTIIIMLPSIKGTHTPYTHENQLLLLRVK